MGRRLGSTHPGDHMTAWEMVNQTWRHPVNPVPTSWLTCAGLIVHLPDEEANYLSGFSHPDGKFHFAPDWASYGDDHEVMPKMPDHLENIDEVI